MELHFSNCKDLRLWEDLVSQRKDKVKSPPDIDFKAVGMTPEMQDMTWKCIFSIVIGLDSHLQSCLGGERGGTPLYLKMVKMKCGKV